MEASRVRLFLRDRRLKIIALVVIAFLAGYLLKSRSQQTSTGTAYKHPGDQADVQKWYCSMHPDIIRDKPGRCPKCQMELVPMPTEFITTAGPRELVVSEEAARLMEIQTSVVERKFVTAEIRMVGKVDYDETKVKNITAWVPGRSRIDRLFVDFTGITVKKGDHMVEIYSPELISAQTEFLLSSTRLLAREKLRLLGLTVEQIEQIERTGKPVDHVIIYAPMGGVVVHKNATEGMYVMEGSKLYTIADLSRLWVKLDAYESDLPWLQYGQEVEFTTEAYPGEVFKGKITFIDPILSDKTRTVKVRVNVDNADGRLKPDMFVRAVARAKVAKGGAVMAADMAGKWICPMHPSVVKDDAGACDICGMDLVTPESIGFVVADTSGEPPLVIPVSAALVTGRELDRAVVYVQNPDAEKPTFEGKEIVLGPRAGDYYIVKSGLVEGEIVVTNGNFKIDSALQIQTKPSMMSVRVERKFAIIDVPDEFRRQFWQVIESYLAVQKALAADDASVAAQFAGQALKSLEQVKMELLGDRAHSVWMPSSARIKQMLESLQKAENIEQARMAFDDLSDELIAALQQFRLLGSQPLYKLHCPMAFDNKGADWLQADKDTRNPYFGASMLKCGKVTEVISGQTE